MFLDIALSEPFTQQAKEAEELQKNFLPRLQKELEPLRAFLEERIRANAPYKTGNLANHTTVQIVQDNEFLGFNVEIDVDYAVEAHEKPGDPDGSEPEGGRGPRFIPRVLIFHQKKIEQDIQAALDTLTTLKNG